MATRYKINPEIEAYLPPGTEDENRLLEAEIVADGFIRDPIIIWKETDTIIDGHRRYRIAQKHGLLDCMKVQKKSFEHIEQVFRWMDEHQLAMRNLTDEQRRYHIGKLYNAEKQSHGGDRKSMIHDDALIFDTARMLGNDHDVNSDPESRVHNDPLIFDTAGRLGNEQGVSGVPESRVHDDPLISSTAERIARRLKISPKTVKRAGQYADQLDEKSPEDRQKILAGQQRQPRLKPTTSGAQKFNKEKFEKSYKILVTMIGEVAFNYGDVTQFGHVRESAELLGLHRLLEQFHTDFKAFVNMLEARQS